MVSSQQQAPSTCSPCRVQSPPLLLKLIRLLRDGPLARTLPPAEVDTHQALLLLALESATSTQQAATKQQFVDKIKANLLKFGLLDRLGAMVAAYGDRYAATSGGMGESKAGDGSATATTALASSSGSVSLPPLSPACLLWHLHKALVVLENATFTSQEGGAHLVALTVGAPSGSSSGSTARLFTSVIVKQVRRFA